jgi:hypothetical protein
MEVQAQVGRAPPETAQRKAEPAQHRDLQPQGSVNPNLWKSKHENTRDYLQVHGRQEWSEMWYPV